MDEYYVGFAHNRPTPSFCVAIDCYKGYMVLVHAKDEEHPNPIWLVKALSSPNFVLTSPNFCQIEVECCPPSTKDQNMLCIYLGWDTIKSFKWKIDIHAGWINTYAILCAWKPHKSSKLETMTIPQKTFRIYQQQT